MTVPPEEEVAHRTAQQDAWWFKVAAMSRGAGGSQGNRKQEAEGPPTQQEDKLSHLDKELKQRNLGGLFDPLCTACLRSVKTSY